MLRRSTKIQLILFVVITLVGISYVSAEYIGLTKAIFNNGCTVHADFKDSGGIFTNAEVTYRGVTVGKVGALQLIDSPDPAKRGVQVDLDLDKCTSPKIPASSQAVVANRSVIGEQYVDLRPPNNKGPYLGNNAVIKMQNTALPTPTEKLLVDLDDFVKSVGLGNLRTTVTELDKAFAGRSTDISNLLDASDQLLQSALEPQNVAATLDLINTSSTVLSTQLDEQQPLQSWTHSLNLLSQQLKASDPDIRRLFDTGPTDLATIGKFIQDNRTALGATLANLETVGNVLTSHLDGIEEILELYPALAAGGPTALHDRQGALGLYVDSSPHGKPPDCGDPNKGQEGYVGTVRRHPSDLSPIAPNVAARCTAPLSSGTNIRGSAHVPGGDPISLSGGGIAYPRVITDNLKAKPMEIGTSLMQPSRLGDASWLSMLTDAVR
jgi:phospholipid/cholesterol/gamma-HCH transport system substrate-binding protein